MASNEQPVDFAEYFRSIGSAVMREPRAEIRQSAALMHEFFTAMVAEGFTEHQAITFLAKVNKPEPPQ